MQLSPVLSLQHTEGTQVSSHTPSSQILHKGVQNCLWTPAGKQQGALKDRIVHYHTSTQGPPELLWDCEHRRGNTGHPEVLQAGNEASSNFSLWPASKPRKRTMAWLYRMLCSPSFLFFFYFFFNASWKLRRAQFTQKFHRTAAPSLR